MAKPDDKTAAISEHLWDMLGALHLDVCQAFTDVQERDSPYNRRSYVRSVFATIEAIAFVLKQSALQNQEDQTFSAAEQAMLLEESYSVKKGQAKVQAKFLPLKENFPFAVNMFWRTMNLPWYKKGPPNFELEKGPGWDDLLRAQAVRNRITHPKQLELLKISEEELASATAGYRWVIGTVIRAHPGPGQVE